MLMYTFKHSHSRPPSQVSIGEFFNTGRGGTAQLENVELNLPAGEFAYVEQFHG